MDETELVARVVKRVTAIRVEKGISRYSLAKETGLSTSGLRHMEIGSVSPTLHYLLVITNCLEVDLSEILGEELGKVRQEKKPSE